MRWWVQCLDCCRVLPRRLFRSSSSDALNDKSFCETGSKRSKEHVRNIQVDSCISDSGDAEQPYCDPGDGAYWDSR
jgi:hypothetical protein